MLVVALPNGRSFAVDAPAGASPDALRAAVEKATGEERKRREWGGQRGARTLPQNVTSPPLHTQAPPSAPRP